MSDIFVFSCLCPSTGHCDEHAGLPFDDLDIMHNKALVEGYSNVRFELTFRAYFPDTDVSDFHSKGAPCLAVYLRCNFDYNLPLCFAQAVVQQIYSRGEKDSRHPSSLCCLCIAH